MLTLPELLIIDAETKPGGMNEECAAILRYYEDSARDLTTARLKQLGVGLKNNPRPLEVSLLARIINRIATVYDRPATRWLSKDGQRLADSTAQHAAMLRVLDRARVDMAWRLVDQTRACVRQCVIRYYPSDVRKGVDLRVFAPQDVLRATSPAAPDFIEQDDAFALRLAGKVYELWNRSDAGWVCEWVDEKGERTARQPGPFAQLDSVSPYGELPVQVVFDSFSGGRAWLPPRLSRRAWVESVNAMANDLWSLIVNQAHTTRVAKFAQEGHHYPEISGHAAIVEVSTKDTIEDLTPSPAIAECQAVLESMLRMWTLSEDLPAEEFTPGRQVVTGAALRVLDRPLLARREAQIPLAIEDERISWRKLRAVHNYHAGAWGAELLDDDLDLEVDIADLDIPVDGAALQDQLAKSIAMGTMSKLDAIQRERNVPRHKAIQILMQVQADIAATAEEKKTEAANGAQLEGAIGVIEKVAAGLIPRQSGVESLAEFMAIDVVRADRIISDAGAGFTPTVQVA